MIRLIAVGRVKAPYYQNGIADYARRIGRFARLEILEVADKDPISEGSNILKKLSGEPIVACDPGGEAWSSPDLARFLGKHGGPCFILGGPDGLSDAVREKADHRLSLGSMTFPHELARLILLEQIYRGFTILRGHPYHR